MLESWHMNHDLPFRVSDALYSLFRYPPILPILPRILPIPSEWVVLLVLFLPHGVFFMVT